jgi:hypothetical protein
MSSKSRGGLSKREYAAKQSGGTLNYKTGKVSTPKKSSSSSKSSSSKSVAPLKGAGPLLPGQTRVADSYTGGQNWDDPTLDTEMGDLSKWTPEKGRASDNDVEEKYKSTKSKSSSSSKSSKSSSFVLPGVSTANAASSEPTSENKGVLSSAWDLLKGAAKTGASVVNKVATKLSLPETGFGEFFGVEKNPYRAGYSKNEYDKLSPYQRYNLVNKEVERTSPTGDKISKNEYQNIYGESWDDPNKGTSQWNPDEVTRKTITNPLYNKNTKNTSDDQTNESIASMLSAENDSSSNTDLPSPTEGQTVEESVNSLIEQVDWDRYDTDPAYQQQVDDAKEAIIGLATEGGVSPSDAGNEMIDNSIMSEQQFANTMGSTVESASPYYQKRLADTNKGFDKYTKTLKGRIPLAENAKNTAIEGVNAELSNLLTKADLGKQGIESQYSTQEEDLKTEKAKLDQDLSRIYQGRGIMDSSYFIKEKQSSDDKFLKTLQTLGTDKSKQLASYDSDIVYYQSQAIQKRSELQQAYEKQIQDINEATDQSQIQKMDSVAAIEKEYQDKLDQVDNKILEYSMKQQEFRQSITKWQAENYTDWKKEAEASIETAKQKSSPLIKKYMDQGFTLAQAQKLAGTEATSGTKKLNSNTIDNQTYTDLLDNIDQGASYNEILRTYPDVDPSYIKKLMG